MATKIAAAIVCEYSPPAGILLIDRLGAGRAGKDQREVHAERGRRDRPIGDRQAPATSAAQERPAPRPGERGRGFRRNLSVGRHLLRSPPVGASTPQRCVGLRTSEVRSLYFQLRQVNFRRLVSRDPDRDAGCHRLRPALDRRQLTHVSVREFQPKTSRPKSVSRRAATAD